MRHVFRLYLQEGTQQRNFKNKIIQLIFLKKSQCIGKDLLKRGLTLGELQ